MKFFRLIGDIFNVSSAANGIKNDGEKRSKSVRFAVSSIVYSLIAVASAVGGALLMTAADESLLFIFLIIIGVVLLAGALTLLIGALVRVIAQLGINRRPLGWVALAVFLLAAAGSVAGAVLILG